MPVEWTPVTNAPSNRRSWQARSASAPHRICSLFVSRETLCHRRADPAPPPFCVQCRAGGKIRYKPGHWPCSSARLRCSCLPLWLSLAAPAVADPGDIDAAARGVVRVVLIGDTGGEIAPVSHGSGFAVTPTRIVTNAHVIREALQDDTLRIGVVPE